MAENQPGLGRAKSWIRDSGKPVLALTLLFTWVYGRFIPRLYFVMDDYIETWKNLEQPLLTVIRDYFYGQPPWSGYRPLAYSVRAASAHLFGMEHITGYHVVGLGLHLANTILFFALLLYLLKSTRGAFIGAALFLLLPSHNEAVLYMCANANLIALFFGLIAISIVMHSSKRLRWWLLPLAWLAYGLSVLAYELMLPLPFFILLLEVLDRRPIRERKRLILYGGFVMVACITTVMRYLAMHGSLVPTRGDYRTSMDLAHLLHNYVLLGGQILLLHTSPWPGAPIFSNLRDWLPLQNPSVVFAIVLTSAITLWVMIDRRKEGADADLKRYVLLFLWGVAWMLVISLPFVALSGRKPENRYVYIPSIGFAVAVAALLAIVEHFWRQLSVLRFVPLLAACTVVVLYARVDASDLREWTLAGQYARTFLTQAKVALPTVPPGSHVFQVGVPGMLGSAYVFTTQSAFNSAIQMLYHDRTLKAEAGDAALLGFLAENGTATDQAYLFVYDQATEQVRVADWVETCTPDGCAYYPLATARDSVEGSRTDARVRYSGGINYEGYRVASVYQSQSWSMAALLVTCWNIEHAGLPDYTFFVHLTDPAGNIVAQADHVLRQSMPFSSSQPAISRWPLNTQICDVVPLPSDPQTPAQPIMVRGGLWLPDKGQSAEILSHQDTQIDESGRMILGPFSDGVATSRALRPEQKP
jgi:protein O-mannosyl-transferase